MHPVLIWYAFGALAIAILVAVHHEIIHKSEPPDDGIQECCLLQPKDFCAFRHTHENWVLLFGVVALVLFIMALV